MNTVYEMNRLDLFLTKTTNKLIKSACDLIAL